LWPEGTLPINMEKVIEIRIGLDIEPIHGLLNLIDMDAYLKMDLTGIVIDCDCYMKEKFSNRLRFSLAHELGHYVLHREIYKKMIFTTPQEWKDFIDYLPESEYGSFEWQSNEFAGRFLVPYEALLARVNELPEVLRQVTLLNYLEKEPDAVLSRVSSFLRKPFGVSEDVIERRVKEQKLWPPKIIP
jgi:Zn-dependent peptidase ImmA (M78 family)